MKKKIKRKVASKKKRTPIVLTRTRYIFIGFASVCLFLFSFLLLNPKTEEKHRECANSLSCVDNLSGIYEEDTVGVFAGRKVKSPPIASRPYIRNLSQNITQASVLGENTDSKHIYVDLTNQKLYAFENNSLVYEFKVSTGKPWTPTPTGDFRVWIKLKYTRMRGGSGSGYYDLPNVPYTMFFYNDKVAKSRGYGIHGAYWHENFGFPMSHGCINLDEPDAEKLYTWATPVSEKNTVNATAENPGTLITIYGETPK